MKNCEIAMNTLKLSMQNGKADSQTGASELIMQSSGGLPIENIIESSFKEDIAIPRFLGIIIEYKYVPNKQLYKAIKK